MLDLAQTADVAINLDIVRGIGKDESYLLLSEQALVNGRLECISANESMVPKLPKVSDSSYSCHAQWWNSIEDIRLLGKLMINEDIDLRGRKSGQFQVKIEIHSCELFELDGKDARLIGRSDESVFWSAGVRWHDRALIDRLIDAGYLDRAG
jgi:hypothetical protein